MTDQGVINSRALEKLYVGPPGDVVSGTYLNWKTFESAPVINIPISPSIVIYKVECSNDPSTTISFDLSQLDLTDKIATWETWLKIATTSTSVVLPSSEEYYYLSDPDLTTEVENETIYLTWRAWKNDSGIIVACNQWGKW